MIITKGLAAAEIIVQGNIILCDRCKELHDRLLAGLQGPAQAYVSQMMIKSCKLIWAPYDVSVVSIERNSACFWLSSSYLLFMDWISFPISLAILR